MLGIFSQTFDGSWLLGPIWGVLSNVGLFHNGRGDTFLNTAGGALIFFLDFLYFVLQTFYVSWLLGRIWGFLSNVSMFHYGWGLSVH